MRLKLLGLLLCVYSSSAVFSQASSPYSRYGMGFLYSPVFGANKAMGEVAAAYNSGFNINYINPASYSALTLTTIELGANVDGLTIRTPDTTVKSVQGSLSHVAIGFPILKNRWGLAVGVRPFSNLNYNFLQHYTDSVLGGYDKFFAGKGSTYELFVGNGVRIGPLRVGINLGVVFGKQSYSRYLSFPDSAEALNVRSATDINYAAFNYNVGLQYQKRIVKRSEEDEHIYLTVGAYLGGGNNFRVRTSELSERFATIDGYVNIVDSPNYKPYVDGKVFMPLNGGGGVMFGNELSWLVGADFKYSNWKKYSSPLNNGPLGDGWRFSLGGMITPEYDAVRGYLKRVTYKAGFYYGQSEVLYKGSNLAELGGTFGLTLPVKKAFARFNLTGDFGTRGNDANVKETFYRFQLGFVLNDFWFAKRKFD